MTSFDRIEPRIADLMEELAAPRIPDYFDTMLGQTARSAQRPAWRSLERWLPMGTIAQLAPVRPSPWRSIAVAVILLLLVVAGLALYAGSQRPVQVPAPPPFGPAANGTILVHTPQGDIVALDAATGTTQPVIAGDSFEQDPVFAADGRTISFFRATGEGGIWVADADGSSPRRLLNSDSFRLDGVEWSQSGDRIVALGRDESSKWAIRLLDPSGGEPVTVHPGRQFASAAMPYGSSRLVLTEAVEFNARYWLMDVDDPANPVRLPASRFAINAPALTPDGTRLVYATWEDGLGTGGNLRLLDLGTREDTLLTTTGNDSYLWQAPQVMPDGATVLAGRWSVDGTYQLTLVPMDGSGAERAIGPARTQDGGGATAWTSPDGTVVLATYSDNGIPDGVTWSIDVASGVGTELGWPAPAWLSWQRTGE